MTHKNAVSSFNTSDRDIATRDTQTRTQGVVIIASENVFKIQQCDNVMTCEMLGSLIEESKLSALLRNICNFLLLVKIP